MSGNITKRMIKSYFQEAAPVAFFSGFFTARPENFHNSEEIEIDVERSGEDVAIAIADVSAGYRANTYDLYTNKSFKPPVYKESVAINGFDLLKRMPGDNPFKDPSFRSNLMLRIFSSLRRVEHKIRRGIELQSSQILQTGKVVLSDKDGESVYELDFKPKTSHFPTAGTSWASATGAQMLADIEALGDEVRANGLQEPDQLIMGSAAFATLIGNADVRELFDIRRIELGTIGMAARGMGGKYRGTLQIGNYSYDIWTYGGKYLDPQTGLSTDYLDPGKVILRASSGRLDASFGAIPHIGDALGQSTRLLPELPGRLSSGAANIDLHTNVWMTPDGEQLYAGLGARPLMIPTAIDTFGCLDTQL